MPHIDDPVDFIAQHVYDNFGTHVPWSAANLEIRALALKDAERAIDGMRLLTKLQPIETAQMLGLTPAIEIGR